MVLEDYTLKHVWGPKTQQAYPFKGSRQDSDPDLGSRRNLHISGANHPERFSQRRQKKPDPGQALGAGGPGPGTLQLGPPTVLLCFINTDAGGI